MMKASYPMLLAFVLSACFNTTTAAVSEGEGKVGETDFLTGNTYAAEKAGFLKFVDPDYPQAGKTYASTDSNRLHIEYFAPDGTFHLWFGGSRRVVAGEWKAEGENICIRSMVTDDSPLPGRWNCGRPGGMANNVVAMTDGDPYGLQSGTAPAHDLRTCRLPPGMLLKAQPFCLPGF